MVDPNTTVSDDLPGSDLNKPVLLSIRVGVETEAPPPPSIRPVRLIVAILLQLYHICADRRVGYRNVEIIIARDCQRIPKQSLLTVCHIYWRCG